MPRVENCHKADSETKAGKIFWDLIAVKTIIHMTKHILLEEIPLKLLWQALYHYY